MKLILGHQLRPATVIEVDGLFSCCPLGSKTSSSKIIDRELLEQFEMISDMDEEERSLVKKILEGVIVKNQVEKLLKPKPEKSWSQRFREITDRLAQGAKDSSQEDIDKVIDEAVASVRKKSYARS